MRGFRLSVSALVAAVGAACSGGSSDTNNTTPTPSLTVIPTEWSVAAGGAAKQFSATLTGSSAPVAWSIETAGTASEVGTMASGLYTPPASLASGRDVVVKPAPSSRGRRCTSERAPTGSRSS